MYVIYMSSINNKTMLNTVHYIVFRQYAGACTAHRNVRDNARVSERDIWEERDRSQLLSFVGSSAQVKECSSININYIDGYTKT